MSPFQPWAHGLREFRLPAEGAAEFSREALAELLENVPLAIAVILWPQQQFAFANRLFRAALSASGDDLAGKPAQEALDAAVRRGNTALREFERASALQR